MKHKAGSLLRSSLRDDSGVSIAWAALLLPLILGVGGLSVDAGYAYIGYRELQISTDAAAMAAAAKLPDTAAASTAATAMGSVPGSRNAYPILNTPYAVSDVQITVTPGCIAVSGLPACGSSFTSNAVKVTQTANLRTFFIRALSAFGISSARQISLKTTAIAAMRGTQRGPYNIAIVVDSTPSMRQSDGGSNCTGTKIACAEQGAQIMLSQLSPCLPNTTCGTATDGNVAFPVDMVSLYTFPGQSNQLDKDQTCRGYTVSPTVVGYMDSNDYGNLSVYPDSTNLTALNGFYQVVKLVSNYRTSDSTSGTNPLSINYNVSSSSPSIVNAVGGNSYFGGSSCAGMAATSTGRTFYAGALYTAWQDLRANSRPNVKNVIVLLSDGDANGATMSGTSLNNSTWHATYPYGSYPSSYKQCKQGVDVAEKAKADGVEIYTVGYAVTSGGCSTDQNLDACSALEQIASSDSHFFVDTKSITSSACSKATTVVMNGQKNSLSAIFSAIVGDLTQPRLVPNYIAFTAS